VTVTGTNIAANAVIASVNSPTQVTLNLAHTGAVTSAKFASQTGIYITSPALGLFTTWQRVFTGIPPGMTAASGLILACPPNQSNVLFMSFGHQSPPNAGNCIRSINGGVTWNTITSVKGTQGSVGFGPPGAGHTTQSMMFLGWYNGTYGVWISDNACDPAVAEAAIVFRQADTANPTPGNPLGSWDLATYFAVDPYTYGKCYVGFNGSSFAYYQP
jgi:hypothetical protein